MSQARSFGRDRGKRGRAPSRRCSLRTASCSSRHLARPSSPPTATGLRRREKRVVNRSQAKTRAQETRTHPDEEREILVQPRTGEKEREQGPETKRDPNRVCTPRISRGALPLTQPRPPSGLTQKPLEEELSQLPLPKGKKGGKPARIVRCLSIHGPHAVFSDPSQRGKARSVARGGWRSECHEWW